MMHQRHMIQTIHLVHLIHLVQLVLRKTDIMLERTHVQRCSFLLIIGEQIVSHLSLFIFNISNIRSQEQSRDYAKIKK